jgi:trans-aconitate methyltransferase
MYADDVDPWGFETRPYEQRKYAITLASLPKDRYGSIFEPGCSVGVLSELLSVRADNLLVTDIIPSALERAAARLEHLPHVRVEQRAIPQEWPTEQFDLIVLSEIAYYFDQADLSQVISRLQTSLSTGAHVIAVHWRGTTDYPLSGDQAHLLIGAAAGLQSIVHHVEGDFVLDVWERER